MMGLMSITHLLSASVPATAITTTNISSGNGKKRNRSKSVNVRDGEVSPQSVSPPAMSSLPFTSPLEEEEEEGDERSGSSLSTASRSSRIPVLTRSSSLRVKSSTSTPESRSGKSKSEPRPGARPTKGIVRSASFGSSRGMAGSLTSSFLSTSMVSSLHHHHHHHHSPTSTSTTPRSHKSLTPETPRRVSSSHARRPNHTVSDRKSHSYAGLGNSWHPGLTYHNHNHTRRPNFLPVANHTTSVPTTPGSQPETPSKSPDQDDSDSVKSLGSVSSTLSCDAATLHHQGTKNGRSLKYVLHCRHAHDEHDPDKYLTPTQRAARRIRELKSQLAEARREVHARDAEISRLTRELVELRLLKARTHHWDDDSQAITEAAITVSHHLSDHSENVTQPRPSPERLTVSEVHPSHVTPTQKVSSATPSEGSEPELSRLMDNLSNGTCETGTVRVPLVSPAARSASETTGDSVELTRSLADSGHYDDLTSPALSARDPFEVNHGSSLRGQPIEEGREAWQEEKEGETSKVEERLREEVRLLQEELQRREEVLRRNHLEEYNELKEKHNDRVESLLAKLSDANLKYFELRPQYTRSQERVRELEAEVTRLRQELGEAELRHQKMYLQMFLKGQQAARLQADDDHKEAEGMMETGDSTTGGTVVGLMRQLAHTQEELEKVKALYHRELTCRNNNHSNNNKRSGELDPEVTLQFLKSAIYYFLTDKDNARGHLRAIESILGYTDRERHNMNKGTK